jgi:hypothetical protein
VSKLSNPKYTNIIIDTLTLLAKYIDYGEQIVKYITELEEIAISSEKKIKPLRCILMLCFSGTSPKTLNIPNLKELSINDHKTNSILEKII